MTTDTQPLTAWEIELADSLLVDVDLSRDVPCHYDACHNPASWAWRHCCRDSSLCTTHHEHMLKLARMYFTHEHQCLACDAYPMPLPVWGPL